MRAKIGDASKCYTNTVRVSAAWEDGIIEARNSTTFEPYYQPLPCCPGAAVAKDSKINATRIFNVIALDRNWGEWKPSPCLDISSNVTECSALMDAYYNELEKSTAVSCCPSNYEVP